MDCYKPTFAENLKNFTQYPNKTPKKESNLTLYKSEKISLCHEIISEEKVKKFFEPKKCRINNAFDQKGTKKFLQDKDKYLKEFVLDDTIIDKRSGETKGVKSRKREISDNHKNFFIKPEKPKNSIFSDDSNGLLEILKELKCKI